MDNLRGLIPYANKEDRNTRTIRFMDSNGDEKYSIQTKDSADRNICYMIKDVFGIGYHEFEGVVGNMGDNDDDEWRACIRKAYIFFYFNQDLISEYGLRAVGNYGDDQSNRLGFTFGFNHVAYIHKRTHIGFTYCIKLINPRNTHIYRYYIGQKTFGRGSDWRFYTSSSEHVNTLLERGWVAEYKILDYHSTQEEMDSVENELILRMWNCSDARENSINYSCVINGSRKLKYDYLGPEHQHNYSSKKYHKRY